MLQNNIKNYNVYLTITINNQTLTIWTISFNQALILSISFINWSIYCCTGCLYYFFILSIIDFAYIAKLFFISLYDCLAVFPIINLIALIIYIKVHNIVVDISLILANLSIFMDYYKHYWHYLYSLLYYYTVYFTFFFSYYWVLG